MWTALNCVRLEFSARSLQFREGILAYSIEHLIPIHGNNHQLILLLVSKYGLLIGFPIRIVLGDSKPVARSPESGAAELFCLTDLSGERPAIQRLPLRESDRQ